MPATPAGGESTPRRLQKQIDKAIGDHRTSASMINAVIGPCGISTRGITIHFNLHKTTIKKNN